MTLEKSLSQCLNKKNFKSYYVLGDISKYETNKFQEKEKRKRQAAGATVDGHTNEGEPESKKSRVDEAEVNGDRQMEELEDRTNQELKEKVEEVKGELKEEVMEEVKKELKEEVKREEKQDEAEKAPRENSVQE
jgi:hypothetical protein